MTAPDDVRARFEAWFGAEAGPDLPLNRMADGGYLCWETGLAWNAYRAAHADLSGEVRELAEEVIEAINDGDAQSARNAAQAALAKYTHQEPRA